MALTQCHECCGRVSDRAQICPHCGAPVIATIKRRQKAAWIELGIRLGAAVLIIVVFYIFWHHTFGNVMKSVQNFQQHPPTPPH